MTHYLILESIWLISLSLFPYMHKHDSSFIISPMDMAILHAKLVWLSVATITTSFSIWLRLSIETLNQYSQNESWLRLSIETLNHPPKTTIVPSPSLFVTVTNEDRDWPVHSYAISNIPHLYPDCPISSESFSQDFNDIKVPPIAREPQIEGIRQELSKTMKLIKNEI